MRRAQQMRGAQCARASRVLSSPRAKSVIARSKTSAIAPRASILPWTAIIVWNTLYLGRAVDELRSRGEIIPDELLAHITPLGWEHIAFNSDYVWPAEPLGNAFRPLRNPLAEFLDAA